MTTTWGTILAEQLELHWNVSRWPRLQGLTGAEYLWEPVPGRRSLRTRRDGEAALQQLPPEPPVPPVTTIAWRLVHLGRDVLGHRARAFFGPSDAPPDADMYDLRHWPRPLPVTAVDALAFLAGAYTAWHDGVALLDDEALLRPLGARGAAFADDSMAELVQHINRETMAHGAELCLLRDLYRARADRTDPIVAAARADDAAALDSALAAEPGAASRFAAARPALAAETAGLRHWAALRVLLEHGVALTSPTGSPSALHYAAAAGAEDVVELLLRHGTDPGRVEATYGMAPAGWAEHVGHRELARRRHGASQPPPGTP